MVDHANAPKDLPLLPGGPVESGGTGPYGAVKPTDGSVWPNDRDEEHPSGPRPEQGVSVDDREGDE